MSVTNLTGSQSDWWRGAVIYQIYPRSFRDSNGDGIGDLKGVLDGLDHVASLGVDGIWVSPFFTSPMDDFGYDIANYCDVDPIFGDLRDFDKLVEKAHRLGLKLIIDQVYSHTSDQHKWFSKSRENKQNDKADWYVWADPKTDGSPPNNWQSVFSGGAWGWDSRRQQYYLHNFLCSQPDLNLHNRDVQDALLDVTRFWLDRGVDGFRLDALNFAMHDPEFRDNPPAPRDGRRLARPFDYQLHLYNQSHPEIAKFLERIRAVTDQYENIFTVAEVVGPEPLTEMKAFTTGDRHLTSAYNFAFLYADTLTSETIIDAVSGWGDDAGEGWPSWAFSNHDAPRAVSRWAIAEDTAKAARLYAMVLLSLRGNAFIYQGEELGLPQAYVPYELLQDPEAIANWPLTLGRDGARTPLPWNSADKNAGFSSSTSWLPIDAEHVPLSIAAQEANPESMLNFIRLLISARKQNQALKSGRFEVVYKDEGILAFTRTSETQETLCVFNLGTKPLHWMPPDAERLRAEISVGLDSNTDVLPDALTPLSGYWATARI